MTILQRMSVVLNAGVPGHNSTALLARLHADVLVHRPTTVVLMVGTNDSLNSQALTPAATFHANLQELVARLMARSRVLLCTILPYHEPYLLARHAVAAYGDQAPAVRHAAVRAAIVQVAEQQSVPCLDLYSVLVGIGNIGEDTDSLLRNQLNSAAADGVHPTAAGYRVIAAAVAVALRAHHLPLERVLCFGDSITYGQYVAGAGTASGETYPGQLARILG